LQKPFGNDRCPYGFVQDREEGCIADDFFQQNRKDIPVNLIETAPDISPYCPEESRIEAITYCRYGVADTPAGPVGITARRE
jgi:hypothetical protein